MVRDTSEIKNKIVNFISRRGPSLPVHIAKEIEMNTLFTSAFLSELLSEKRIKSSNMKIGGSPLYFNPGQEHLLENFSEHLKNKEKEAFIIIKREKILEDKKQEPAIRVALRSIKDFAIPFKRIDSEELYWRYFTEEVPKTKEKEEIKEEVKKEVPEKVKEKKLNIFDKKEIPKKKIAIKKKIVRKTSNKKNEKFFNRVKEFLSKKSIEIIDIENFNKNDLVLKVKDNDEEKILVAYNKKRISESDIINAHKKTKETGLQYIIISLGEPLKKIENLIESIKKLDFMGKIE